VKSFDRESRALLAAARAMGTTGLTHGTSGNASVRVPGGFLVTPSGVPYGELSEEDLVLVLSAAESDPGPDARGRRPSTEWRLHRAVYAARPDAGAIVHAHSEAATALACLRRGIPAFHYMVAAAGGASIRCAEYATFGTEELARAAVRALEERSACLLANHGQVALGRDPAAALALAREVEVLARQYLKALAVGEPVLLSGEEMERVMEAFGRYRRAAEEA
jgi:L-fuculose-phosphate aldolase